MVNPFQLIRIIRRFVKMAFGGGSVSRNGVCFGAAAGALASLFRRRSFGNRVTPVHSLCSFVPVDSFRITSYGRLKPDATMKSASRPGAAAQAPRYNK